MSDFFKILAAFSLILTAIPCAVFALPESKASKSNTVSAQSKENFDVSEISKISSVSTKDGEISTEEYLTGCVLAQMPADFHTEALKCQAVIARTSLYYNEIYGSEAIGQQSFFTVQEAKTHYGEEYEKAYSSALDAVRQTEGEFLAFEGCPIVTAFHPISAGFTESSEDIFSKKLPYLTSVESPYDSLCGGFEQKITFSSEEFYSRLCAYFQLEKPQSISECNFEITDKTKNGSVISFAFLYKNEKKEATGIDFARIFGLNSCCFDITFDNNLVTAVCKGGGHLVGLSQWGADYLAKKGDTYKEILYRYFSGASVETAR